MADGIHRFRGARRQAAQAHVAAPGIERAVHRQLADAAQVDRLAGVHMDHRALADGERRGRQLRGGGIDMAGSEAHTGAPALGQHAFGSVFLIQRRRPAFQCGGRIATGWHTRGLCA
ncbi:hypothetical protein PS706_03314 [Pseudomonas fluorescens]|nr:hypothetical protein PS706_03314 [Pseudomonas fluorescens]